MAIGKTQAALLADARASQVGVVTVYLDQPRKVKAAQTLVNRGLLKEIYRGSVPYRVITQRTGVGKFWKEGCLHWVQYQIQEEK
jgi:hypothetical protein